MPQSRKFWENVPSTLKFTSWSDLVASLIANGIAAVVLGVVIGGLFGFFAEKVGILWGCLGGILLFVIICSCEQIFYFFRYLCRFALNKQQDKKGGQE